MRESGEYRDLQSQIYNSISSKNEDFGKCAERSQLYKKLKQDRIRVVLSLDINYNGELEKFQLDDKDYPSDFSDCVFGVLELVNFPKNSQKRIIEVEQPFIFSKR